MTRTRPARAAIAVLGLAALSACARDAGCPDDWCGTAVVVSAADADVLMPPVTHTDVGTGVVDLVFAKLGDVGPGMGTVGDTGFVPVLARSWRRDDALTLSFSLRPDARWHDGANVTAEDVAFTFDVYRDTAVGSPAAPRLARIASVTARDSLTVVFRFRDPYPEQLFDAVYHMRILPRHLLGAVPRGELASHAFGRSPVGCGPFRFVRWRAGEAIELAADSAFFLGRPGLRRVIWRITPDPAAAVSQLIAGEADVMGSVGGPDEVRRVQQAAHLRAVPYPIAVYGFIGFNFADARGGAAPPHPLCADRALRRALAMAVDREAVVRAVLGQYGEVPVGPLTRGLWIWSDSAGQLPFDSAAARRSLAELGWRDSDRDGVLDRAGRKLAFTLLVPASSGLRRRAAVVVQAQLRRFGVDMKIGELEFNIFMSRTGAHRFDAYFGAWAQDPSPASIRDTWTSEGAARFNLGRYANPRVDSLVEQALRAGDLAAARDRWRAALAEINADAPAIWLYAPIAVAAVHRRFDNVALRTDQWAASLWTWRVRPRERIERDHLAAQ